MRLNRTLNSEQVGLPVQETEKSSIIRYFRIYLKNSTSHEQRRKGINYFQIFHASSRSTCGQKMNSKILEHLNAFRY